VVRPLMGARFRADARGTPPASMPVRRGWRESPTQKQTRKVVRPRPWRPQCSAVQLEGVQQAIDGVRGVETNRARAQRGRRESSRCLGEPAASGVAQRGKIDSNRPPAPSRPAIRRSGRPPRARGPGRPSSSGSRVVIGHDHPRGGPLKNCASIRRVRFGEVAPGPPLQPANRYDGLMERARSAAESVSARTSPALCQRRPRGQLSPLSTPPSVSRTLSPSRHCNSQYNILQFVHVHAVEYSSICHMKADDQSACPAALETRTWPVFAKREGKPARRPVACREAIRGPFRHAARRRRRCARSRAPFTADTRSARPKRTTRSCSRPPIPTTAAKRTRTRTPPARTPRPEHAAASLMPGLRHTGPGLLLRWPDRRDAWHACVRENHLAAQREGAARPVPAAGSRVTACGERIAREAELGARHLPRTGPSSRFEPRPRRRAARA